MNAATNRDKISDILKAANAADKRMMINEELKALLGTYEQKESYDELKRSIEADGIRDPIIVWKETNEIVDGHNRYTIAEELGIECPMVVKSFPDIASVKEFMIRNQLGRRNLTPAKFTYYLGKLYNEMKEAAVEAAAKTPVVEGAPKPKPVTETVQKLAKDFDVSPKTVARAGEQAKGIDAIERVKGKLAAAQQLTSKPTYTAEEVAAIGSASNATVAAKAINSIDGYKKQNAQKKAQNKAVTATLKEKAIPYHVALVQPDFASGLLSSEPKPFLEKDSAVWMLVPDEHLHDAMKLIGMWNLEYQASFIFWSSGKTYEGVFSKIVHQYLILATKGHILGPDKNKESPSVIMKNGDITADVIKLIENYSTPKARKLDMRRVVKPATGWDAPTK